MDVWNLSYPSYSMYYVLQITLCKFIQSVSQSVSQSVTRLLSVFVSSYLSLLALSLISVCLVSHCLPVPAGFHEYYTTNYYTTTLLYTTTIQKYMDRIVYIVRTYLTGPVRASRLLSNLSSSVMCSAHTCRNSTLSSALLLPSLKLTSLRSSLIRPSDSHHTSYPVISSYTQPSTTD